MSSNTAFIVLYTHQKTKKNKTWHDGKLKVLQDNKAHLYDDSNNHIDTLYLKPTQISVGANLESAKYIITVDDEEKTDTKLDVNKQSLPSNVKSAQPKSTRLYARTRKGFTVPRQMNKTSDVEPKESLHKRPVGHHQSNSVQLFSTPFLSVQCQSSTAGCVDAKSKGDQDSSREMNINNQQYPNPITDYKSFNIPSSSERTFRNSELRVGYSLCTYQEKNLISDDHTIAKVSDKCIESNNRSIEETLADRERNNELSSSSGFDTDVQYDLCQIDSQRKSNLIDFPHAENRCHTNNNIRTGLKRNRVQILELLGSKKKKIQVPLKHAIQTVENCSDSKIKDSGKEGKENQIKFIDLEMASKVSFYENHEDPRLNVNQKITEAKNFRGGCQRYLEECVAYRLDKNLKNRKSNNKNRKSNLGDGGNIFVQCFPADLNKATGIKSTLMNSNNSEENCSGKSGVEEIYQECIQSIGDVSGSGKLEIDRNHVVIDSLKGLVDHAGDQELSEEQSGILYEDGKDFESCKEANNLEKDGNKCLLEETMEKNLETQSCFIAEDNESLSKEGGMVSQSLSRSLSALNDNKLRLNLRINTEIPNVVVTEKDGNVTAEDFTGDSDRNVRLLEKFRTNVVGDGGNECNDVKLMFEKKNLCLSDAIFTEDVGTVKRNKNVKLLEKNDVSPLVNELSVGDVASPDEQELGILEDNFLFCTGEKCNQHTTVNLSDDDKKDDVILEGHRKQNSISKDKTLLKNENLEISDEVCQISNENMIDESNYNNRSDVESDNFTVHNVVKLKLEKTNIARAECTMLDDENELCRTEEIITISDEDSLLSNSAVIVESDNSCASDNDSILISEEIHVESIDTSVCTENCSLVLEEDFMKLVPTHILSGDITKKVDENTLKIYDGKLQYKCNSPEILVIDDEYSTELHENLPQENEALQMSLEDEIHLSPDNYAFEKLTNKIDMKESIIVNKNFKEIQDSMLEGSETKLNSVESQQRVLSSSSSQETSTSADTYDFLPISSPLEASYHSDGKYPNFTIEVETENISKSQALDDKRSSPWKKGIQIESQLNFHREFVEAKPKHFAEGSHVLQWLRTRPIDNHQIKDLGVLKTYSNKVNIPPSIHTNYLDSSIESDMKTSNQTLNMDSGSCTGFGDYKKHYKGMAKFGVPDVTSKIDGYHWKGAKCSQTAKRSLSLSTIHKTSSGWSDLNADVLGQNSRQHNSLETFTLLPQPMFTPRHPEPHKPIVRDPTRDIITRDFYNIETCTPCSNLEDDNSFYGHNLNQDMDLLQRSDTERLSQYLKTNRKERELKNSYELLEMDFDRNSQDLINNQNKLAYQVKPDNSSDQLASSRFEDILFKTPDHYSENSYLRLSDDNFIYDVTDTETSSCISEYTKHQGTSLCQMVPQQLDSVQLCQNEPFYQDVPGGIHFKSTHSHQNIQEEFKDRNFYQTVPEEFERTNAQQMPSTQFYPESSSNDRDQQKTQRFRSLLQEVPRCTEIESCNSQCLVPANTDDVTLSLHNLATDYKTVSQYCVYDKTSERQMMQPLKSVASNSAIYNNRNLDIRTRERQPLISQPPDEEIELKERLQAILPSENASKRSIRSRIHRLRSSEGSHLSKESRDSNNISQMKVVDKTPNITLTLDQSLSDELDEFFGDDINEMLGTINTHNQRSNLEKIPEKLLQDNTDAFKNKQKATGKLSISGTTNENLQYVSCLENTTLEIGKNSPDQCIKSFTFNSQEENIMVSNKKATMDPGKIQTLVSNKPNIPDLGNCLVVSNRKNSAQPGQFQDLASDKRSVPSIDGMEQIRRKNVKKAFCKPLHNLQMGIRGKLTFSSKEDVDGVAVPTRQTIIPVLFDGVPAYKATLNSAIKEHLNILMFSVSQRYHQALTKVDISRLAPGHDGHTGADTNAPMCQHNTTTKMVCVKKNGPNKGRFFYTCSQPRSSQCKFFLWADQYKQDNTTRQGELEQFVPKLSSPLELRNFMKSLGLALHCSCQLIRKAWGSGLNHPNLPPWIKKYRRNTEDAIKKKLFLKLIHKDVSSAYAKDDLWVISSSLQFDPGSSFIAKSVYHGPSSNMEIEVEPVAGYSPSNWESDSTVHGLLIVNASSELAQLANIDEHVTLTSVPVLPYLMDCSYNPEKSKNLSSKTFRSPLCSMPKQNKMPCTSQEIEDLASEFISTYHLNEDQAEALLQVASMFDNNRRRPPITLIHGVFGAGKSFLLSVVVLFLVQLFAKSDELETVDDVYWRLLISSTTNVAVDRILMGLLDLGFEDFIRVGSLRKISKPVLPYSVHASDKQNDDMKELQEMLKSDITPTEKQLIKKSLERQRLGHNKALLAQVKVVAVTCAASAFPCIDKLKFPVVLLDECSQMTEPMSLLPIAKFHCEKLVLVGDPKQLPPTIQGSETETEHGLEQTLFDRLVIMGIETVMLRTQYRCHPHISALSNHLFYDNQLIDGVTKEQRQQLMENLPTLCFYNVHDGHEQCSPNGSYYNIQEVKFVATMLQVILQHEIDATEIGVITLYRAQAFMIAEFLKNETSLKPHDVRGIQISTVDAFQGGEKNVILLSCVRTDYVGFIDSYKRTNVALTRSKYHLFIIGHLGILSQNQLWGQVIKLCQEHPRGIQSAIQFIQKWKDTKIESKKTKNEIKEQIENKNVDGSTPVDIIDITDELNEKKIPNDESTTLHINESGIPVDSQGSPSYSPLEEPITSGSKSNLLSLNDNTSTVSAGCTSPSYAPLEEVKTSSTDFSSLELDIQLNSAIYTSPSYSPLEKLRESEIEKSTPFNNTGYTSPSNSPICELDASGGNDYLSLEKSTKINTSSSYLSKEEISESGLEKSSPLNNRDLTSPSYLPHEKIKTPGNDLEHNSLDMTGYSSPSYSPLMGMQLSDSDNDLPNINF